MAESTEVSDELTTGADSTGPWTWWMSVPLPRRLVAPAIAGAIGGLLRWVLAGGDWSTARFIFYVVWWAGMLPVISWSVARRRSS